MKTIFKNKLGKYILIFLAVSVFSCGAKNVFAQSNTNPSYVPLIGISSVPEPLSLPDGPGDVTYRYAVKNFLQEYPLTDVKVTDTSCSVPKFVEGDDNNDGKLDFSETWRYTCKTKLLRMIFQNLLSNATEYTPSGGKIKFSISFDDSSLSKVSEEQNKKTILIKVSDTGYGIPKGQQSQIFTKFFRADNVVDKDTKGTGLGLYIIKSIIENSGGKIWFESPPASAEVYSVAKENPGTTFFVTFPVQVIR